MENPRTQSLTEIAGKNAALLSAIEVGLGSLLHGLKIPFGGHFLSLNEGFFLARASVKGKTLGAPRSFPATISNITAAMKSLSPAGKRLTPMLAISAQGLLFSLGITLFGINPLGIVLGLSLLSLWAFAQPLLIAYVLFGDSLVQALAQLYQSLKPWDPFGGKRVIFLLVSGVLLKLVLAVIVAWVAVRLPEKNARAYERRLLTISRRRKNNTAATIRPSGFLVHCRLALKDLFHPLFVFSLLITLFFFLFLDSPWTKIIWALMRPIGIGFILFLLIRLLPWDKWLTGPVMARLPRFRDSFQTAIAHLKEIWA